MVEGPVFFVAGGGGGGRKTPDNNTQTLQLPSHSQPGQGGSGGAIDGEGYKAWVMPFTRGRIGLEL